MAVENLGLDLLRGVRRLFTSSSDSLHHKVRKTAKIRKLYNQVPHLIQETTRESIKYNPVICSETS